MKWNVSVGMRLYIDYDDIEAEDEEEAKEIAKERALEDIDFNNCDCDPDLIVYCVYPEEESEVEAE